jgi:hypothetical protein
MIARYLNIVEKCQPFVATVSNLANFKVSDGEEVDPGIILSDPKLSPYCLDDATRRIIFVELPADVNLAAVPFIYQTQYEHAVRLLAMSYDTFREVAHTLPAVENLILVYISGRSGSTLLSHVFNTLDNVVSLSEPDITTQFVELRGTDGSRDAELTDLFRCLVRVMFKPAFVETANTFALKFRSEALRVMDLYQAAFPQAHNLFLYRDALGFAASFYRIFKRAHLSETMPLSEFITNFGAQYQRDISGFAAYLAADTSEISMAQLLAMWWIITMESYQDQYERGIPILAVRYADLNAQREQVLTAIFDYCGLPTKQVAQTLSVFERDSQAGTILAREKPTEGNAFQLTDEQIAEITTILARHPLIKVSDFIAPGTLTL